MLYNATKKTKIIEKIVFADSFWKRFKGLMLFPEKKFGFALVFPLEVETILGASIHMLFVLFPIDVAWLDKNKKIVDFELGLKPWALNRSPKKPAKYIVELPVGALKGRISVGDALKF